MRGSTRGMLILSLILAVASCLVANVSPGELLDDPLEGGGSRGSQRGAHTNTSAVAANRSKFFRPQRSTRAVIVVTTQRSGSGWVLRMLESKSPPLDYRDKEPFGLLAHQVRNFNTESAEAFEQHVAQVFGERCDRASAVTCGFKVMYSQILYPDVLFDFCARHNVAVVHLVRQNVLRRYISRHFLALDHHRSQVTKGEAEQLGQQWKQEPFDFDAKTFPSLAVLMDELQQWRDVLRDASLRGVESIEISYEQLQYPQTCSAFLGFVAPELLRSSNAGDDGHVVDCSLAPEFSDVQQHGEYHCANFIRDWGNFTAQLRDYDGLKKADKEYMIQHCELGIEHVTTFDEVADNF
jgi:LPS sulfotransferase NodH